VIPKVPFSRMLRPWFARLLPALALATLAAAPARAVLDIRDGGPLLEAGRFSMRVTNAGILGNAYFDVGLSYDPSLEYPRGSGIELLNHAELWVGAVLPDGSRRVSGGPMLEFRPTRDPDDHVWVAWRDRLGAKRMVDDDGDGRVDEETLNGRDDDGDGEVDEDLGMGWQQMTAADYVDDRPEAIEHVYENGERHAPLGLSVHQETYAWSLTDADRVAGLSFHITNHGTETLRDLQMGVMADLDSRLRSDRTGHQNDLVKWTTYSRQVSLGSSIVTVSGQKQDPASKSCADVLRQTVPVVADGIAASGLPMVALVGLGHTTDPYNGMPELRAYARAPQFVAFRSAAFRRGEMAGAGGPPMVDDQRYAALAGELASGDGSVNGDWMVLVSCGPFASLAPGQSIDVQAAFVMADRLDSLVVTLADAAFLHRGTYLNLQRDTAGQFPTDWNEGVSGTNGHDTCVEPPAGVGFYADPHCPSKLRGDVAANAESPPVLYSPGHCVWTDTDCDECTGMRGWDTVQRWLDPGEVLSAPARRVTAGEHGVDIAWDNRPELLLAAGRVGSSESRFLGYRVYRIADWSGRQSLLPPNDRWALFGAYAYDTLNGERLLTSVTDSTVDYERILYERPLYPVGRYRVHDAATLDGFPYLYTVTSVYQSVVRLPDGTPYRRVIESPIEATFDEAVIPHVRSRDRAGLVWVVPNPFRAHADWDLPPVDGDRLTRHLDFMGLPRARSVIRIWTVAGDFVAQLDHDGSAGDGQAKWDLVSRNGQEIESGIYLFTVDSPLGHQVGRFVVVR
jgi:hypothetical protein